MNAQINLQILVPLSIIKRDTTLTLLLVAKKLMLKKHY